MQPPPSGVGPYARDIEVNVSTDDVLSSHAGWDVALGTIDEARFPAIHVNMAALAAHDAIRFAAAKQAGVGSRITIASPPAWLPPELIDQMAIGYSETIAHPNHWDITFVNTPHSVYSRIGVYGVDPGGVVSRYDSATSKLVAPLTTTATLATVAAGNGASWTTQVANYPFDLFTGGERVTATAVAAVTFTPRVAGAAAHGDNAAVVPGLPAALTVGDAMFLLAAIRNAVTGTVVAPAGWQTLVAYGNMSVFAKFAGAGEVAPTVTFTGGVAGDSTSAQIFAAAGCGIDVHAVAVAQNASAANIALPALGVDLANCVVLATAWKADDWTSVATLAGFTEIGEPSTTLGNDQGIVWDFVLQSTPSAIGPATFTVTGGAAAQSRAIMLAIGAVSQTFTIVRSVNGVVKTHLAAAPISLFTPSHYGL